MIASPFLSLAAMAVTASAAFECTRDYLQDTVDKYIDMQVTGQHDRFENLAYTMVYLENNKTSSILSGMPAYPIVVAANRSSLDTTQCKTFTELIVTDPTHPYVIHTQMSLDEVRTLWYTLPRGSVLVIKSPLWNVPRDLDMLGCPLPILPFLVFAP